MLCTQPMVISCEKEALRWAQTDRGDELSCAKSFNQS